MKNSPYTSNRLDDLYGRANLGPLPAGATNWKQIAIYGCVAGAFISGLLYGMHRIQRYNTRLLLMQIKPLVDLNKSLNVKIDKMSLELEELKTKQSTIATKIHDTLSKDINHEEAI